MLTPAIASLRKDLALLPERVRRCRANRASDAALHDAAAAISNPARRFPSLTGEFLKLSHRGAPLMQCRLALPAGADLW
jgi:hypothetical protein